MTLQEARLESQSAWNAYIMEPAGLEKVRLREALAVADRQLQVLFMLCYESPTRQLCIVAQELNKETK